MAFRVPPNVAKLVAGSGIIAVLGGIITNFEGRELVAYKDIVGIWTICDGETKGVKPGQHATDAECRAMLAKRLPPFIAAVDKAMPGLPDNKRVAYASAAYNLGTAYMYWQKRGLNGKLIPGSSVAELENSKQSYDSGCLRLGDFVTAGGKFSQGVANRRMAEVAICLQKN